MARGPGPADMGLMGKGFGGTGPDAEGVAVEEPVRKELVGGYRAAATVLPPTTAEMGTLLPLVIMALAAEELGMDMLPRPPPELIAMVDGSCDDRCCMDPLLYGRIAAGGAGELVELELTVLYG
jgi:hypothetical protein